MGLGGSKRLALGPETSWQELCASCSGQAGIEPVPLGRSASDGSIPSSSTAKEGGGASSGVRACE